MTTSSIRKMGLLAAVSAVLVATCAASAAPVENKGKIEAVTVYRGQALITRVVELNAPGGSTELVVTDLPAQILPDSLFASGDGVQIRAVRFRARAVKDEPRQDVREVENKIRDLQKEIRQAAAHDKLIKQRDAYLTNLEKFTTAKITIEMEKGTLDAETVKSLTSFLFEQRASLAEAALDLGERHRELNEQLSLLQRQLSEMTALMSHTAREAVIFLDKAGPGASMVRLSYMVQGANWTPIYNLRAAGVKDPVGLEYNALIQQMSGEDWDGVKLTLSTASPSMVSEAPILSPLWVTLASDGGKQDALYNTKGYLIQSQQVGNMELNRAISSRSSNNNSAGEQFDLDWAANAFANRLQIMDILASKEALLAGRLAMVADSALSVNYVLPSAISLPSRSDQQMIQIAALKLKGNFYNLAVPVLTPYVYQQADVVNTSEIALLAGPVSSYMDGQFMGTGNIPMVAKGQMFTVGLGVDSQLRVARELADKIDKVQGGNREMTFNYRLLIDNYKDTPVTVRLMDRLPDPQNADIRVTPMTFSTELSRDPVYLRTLRKDGILLWEVEVPAKSSGATSKTVEYQYRMEFDRNMTVAEPSAAQVEQGKARFRQSIMDNKRR